MPKKTPAKRISSLQRAAYHEAGHAVACYAFHRRFERVSILKNEEKGTVGHLPFEPVPLGDSEAVGERRVDKRLENELVIHLAGLAATAVLTGRRAARGDDLKRAAQLAQTRCTTGDETTAYLKWLLIRTENEMRKPAWWHMVEAVAEELIRHKQAPYTRARWLMESTLDRR